MAHELTMNAQGMAEMAFAGQTPWHSLGQRVSEGASVEEWARQARMTWTAERSVVQYQVAAGGLLQAPEKHVIYRSDNGMPLGVVGSNYQIVQPIDCLEFFRSMAEAGNWHIHTAGTLQGGRKLWALARNGTEGYAAKGDKVRGNMLFATSLDGSLATIVGMTAIRVVCANTIRVALNGIKNDKRKGVGDSVTVSHRSIFDADAVKAQLGVAHQSFDAFMSQAREMAETPIGQDEAREVLRSIFGQPTVKNVDAESAPSIPVPSAEQMAEGQSDFARLMGVDKLGVQTFAELMAKPLTTQREQRSVPKVLELFNGAGMGSTAPGSAGTKWGLFNAITQHVDHDLGRSADTRLQAAWFGRGHDMKTKALSMLAPSAAVMVQ